MCLSPYEFFVLTYLTFDNYSAISLYFSFTRRRVNFRVEVFFVYIEGSGTLRVTTCAAIFFKLSSEIDSYSTRKNLQVITTTNMWKSDQFFYAIEIWNTNPIDLNDEFVFLFDTLATNH